MTLTRRRLIAQAAALAVIAPILPLLPKDPDPVRVVVDPGWDGGTILIAQPEDWLVHDYTFAFSAVPMGVSYYNYPQVFR